MRKANFSYFIFKKGAQRLYQIQMHFFGKPAHIVMRFNGDRWPVHRNAFNHIGINGSLPEKRNSFDFFRLLLENIYEEFTNGLAFLLGFR